MLGFRNFLSRTTPRLSIHVKKMLQHNSAPGLCRQYADQAGASKPPKNSKLSARLLAGMGSVVVGGVICHSFSDKKEEPANSEIQHLTPEEGILLNEYLKTKNLSATDVVIICGNKLSSNIGFMSYYPASFQLDGRRWASAEHYLQVQKINFIGNVFLIQSDRLALRELRERLLATQDTNTAINLTREKFFSKERSLNDLLSDEWHKDFAKGKRGVLARANMAKLEYHSQLTDKLLATDNKTIVAVSTNKDERFWTIASEDNKTFGGNEVGKILMGIRTELKCRPKPPRYTF